MSTRYYVVTYDEGTCNEPKIDTLLIVLVKLTAQ